MTDSRCGPHNIRMNVEQIRARLTGGFRPFAIRTSDGREYPVPHPEFLAVGRHAVGVVDKQGYIVSLDPQHIVALQDLVLKKAA